MPTGFPPLPVYPYGIDSDYTLYQVYNTTEAKLTANNEPWAEEVHVQPRVDGQDEIWPDNGFATISGEMFYYEAVDKDDDGYVTTLKRCVRNLGGAHTKANLAGTVVRGFVMAEHHNQLVEAILRVEDFVGENFTEEQETLDWRIRNLRLTPIIFDDFDAPDVNFTFTIVSNDPASGILANYTIGITGTYNQFLLNFGDGTFTRSPADGEHRYAPNGTVDPIIIISNDKTEVIQSPITRIETTTPEQEDDDLTINIPVPLCPEIGDIFIPPVSVPPQDIVFPPIVFPCLDVSPFPSTFFGPISITVDFSPLNLPSLIEIVVPNISIPPIEIVVPSIPPIEISPISIPPIEILVPSIPPIEIDVPEFPGIGLSVPSIPNISLIVPEIPPVTFEEPPVFEPVTFEEPPCISVCYDEPPAFPDIHYDNPPEFPFVHYDNPPEFPYVHYDDPPEFPYVHFDSPPEFPYVHFDSPPAVTVNWGSPPTIPVNVTVSCNCACCPSATAINFQEPEFVDTFNPFTPNQDWSKPEQMEINYDFQGFPSVIVIEPPVMPDVKVVHELPSSIDLLAPDKMLIEYIGPAIPNTIQVVGPEEPLTIEIVGPKSIKLDADDVLNGISLIAPDWNPRLLIDASMLPSSIQVVGMPSSVELVYNGPTSIKLEMPDNPTIQMLPPTEAIPISVMVTLAMDGVNQMLSDEQRANMQCVAIVPCPMK